jgi:prepilin-type N-terminal cleavage/methylation domain-containing protein
MIILQNKKQKSDKQEIIKSLPGFTLIEVLVSVVLFSAIILSVTSLFKLSIDAQREAIAVQNVQESLKYFLEVTAKEIRMAKRNDGACPYVPDDKIFHVSSNGKTLYFKNYYGECVDYELDQDSDGVFRFLVRRGVYGEWQKEGFISPGKINIDQLAFAVRDNEPDRQPLVTINIKATALGDKASSSEMVLQTSISSRFYK